MPMAEWGLRLATHTVGVALAALAVQEVALGSSHFKPQVLHHPVIMTRQYVPRQRLPCEAALL